MDSRKERGIFTFAKIGQFQIGAVYIGIYYISYIINISTDYLVREMSYGWRELIRGILALGSAVFNMSHAVPHYHNNLLRFGEYMFNKNVTYSEVWHNQKLQDYFRHDSV